MQTPFNPADCDLIADFEIFLRYLRSKPNIPLTTTGELEAADLWAWIDKNTQILKPHQQPVNWTWNRYGNECSTQNPVR